MNVANLAALVAATFAQLAASGLTHELSVSGGGGGDGEIPWVFTLDAVIIRRVPANRVDGVTVLPNDEQLRFQVAEFEGEPVSIEPGVVFQDVAADVTRTCITAHKDAAGLTWVCVVRRVF